MTHSIPCRSRPVIGPRSEEHTSELSHITISYAVFCLKKKINQYVIRRKPVETERNIPGEAGVLRLPSLLTNVLYRSASGSLPGLFCFVVRAPARSTLFP